mgnify:CR=1 FL=1
MDRLTVTELPGRNRVFRVETGPTGGCIVKQTGIDRPDRQKAIRREADCCRLAMSVPELQGVIPEVIRYDDMAHYLVQPIVPGEPAGRALRRGGENRAAAALGTALARVHRHLSTTDITSRDLVGADSLPWILRDKSLAKAVRHTTSLGQAALARLLVDHPALLEQLKDTAKLWAPSCAIHADLKLSNVIVTWEGGDQSQPQATLIDWELVQTGDPAWDVAGIVQSFIVSAIGRLPADSAADGRTEPDLDDGPLSAAAAAGRHFIQAYHEYTETPKSALDGFNLRILRYAGARMVQSAYEAQKFETGLIPGTVRLIQAGLNLMREPEEFRPFICFRQPF